MQSLQMPILRVRIYEMLFLKEPISRIQSYKEQNSRMHALWNLISNVQTWEVQI